jgi:hypothetical protein
VVARSRVASATKTSDSRWASRRNAPGGVAASRNDIRASCATGWVITWTGTASLYVNGAG